MSIPYWLVASRNPATGAEGFRPSVAVLHRVDPEEITKMVSLNTTVGPADVAAVLAQLSLTLRSCMENGWPVTLAGIGTFHVRIYGRQVEKPGEFLQQTHLERAAIRFRTSRLLRAAERNFQFRLADVVRAGMPPPQALPPADEGDAA